MPDVLPATPLDDDPEVVEGQPVAPQPPSALPPALRGVADLVLASQGGRQMATLAGSGFLAGAVTMALAHRRKSRRAVKRLRGRRNGRPVLGEIVHTNSFVVDVHLLRRD